MATNPLTGIPQQYGTPPTPKNQKKVATLPPAPPTPPPDYFNQNTPEDKDIYNQRVTAQDTQWQKLPWYQRMFLPQPSVSHAMVRTQDPSTPERTAPLTGGAVQRYVESHKGAYTTGKGKKDSMSYGLARGAAKQVDELSTPNSISSLALLTSGTGLLPGAAIKLLGYGISAISMMSLAQRAPEAVKAFNNGDDELGWEHVSRAVPELAMAIPGAVMATHDVPALARSMEQEGYPLWKNQEGFIYLDYSKGDRVVGRDAIQGPERIKAESTWPKATPTDASVNMKTAPAAGEVRTGMNYLIAQGIDPRTITYYTGFEGTPRRLNFDQFIKEFPEALDSPQLQDILKPMATSSKPEGGSAPAITSTIQPSLTQAPSSAQQFSRTPAGRFAASTPPTNLPQTRQPYGSNRIAAEPPAPQTAPMSSQLEQAVMEMMKFNQRMGEWMMQQKSGGVHTPPPEPPPPAVQAAAAAAPKPAATPAAAPTSDLADIQASVKQAELMAPKKKAALSGEPGTTKKGPTSYVGKTLKEKYAPKEPAAQPGAGITTPSNHAELATALEKLSSGDGPPVYITRGGKRGQLLEAVYDAQGEPTGTYMFMPDAPYSGDPFSIKLGEIQPHGTRSEVSVVPRGPAKTRGTGPEISAAGKKSAYEQVQLPNGGTGVKLKTEVMPKETVDAIVDSLGKKAAGGDTESAAKLARIHKHISEDGTITTHEVLMGKEATTVQARHLGGTKRSTTAEDLAAEGIVRTPKAVGGAPGTEYTDKGIVQTFYDSEVPSLAKTVEPTTTQPSKQITPATAAAEAEVRERMTAAGGEQAQPQKTISTPGISGKAIAKAKGLIRPAEDAARVSAKLKATAKTSKPEETFEGQRKREMADEEAYRKRMEYKPGATTPIKPTPPPTSATEAHAFTPEAIAKRTREQQLAEKAKQAPKSSAKITDKPTTKGYTQPVTPERRKWGRGELVTPTPPPTPPPSRSGISTHPEVTEDPTFRSAAERRTTDPDSVKLRMATKLVKDTPYGGATDSHTLSHPSGGTMTFKFTDDGVYIDGVDVPEGARNHGIAKALYTKLGIMMRERGIPGSKIDGNITGPRDIIMKLRGTASKVAGEGTPDVDRYDID